MAIFINLIAKVIKINFAILNKEQQEVNEAL
jgi:hypothetical protein